MSSVSPWTFNREVEKPPSRGTRSQYRNFVVDFRIDPENYIQKNYGTFRFFPQRRNNQQQSSGRPVGDWAGNQVRRRAEVRSARLQAFLPGRLQRRIYNRCRTARRNRPQIRHYSSLLRREPRRNNYGPFGRSPRRDRIAEASCECRRKAAVDRQRQPGKSLRGRLQNKRRQD